MSQVPFLDLKASYQALQDEIEAAMLKVGRAGWYIKGQAVETFESEFAHYTNASHCVGVASGLDALKLALKALDVGPGDEVIVPAHTFIATWLAVSEVGATIVPVSAEVDGFNLDLDQIENKITSKTKAIIPVHLYGVPVDMVTLKQLAIKHDLYLIEDAAQAHGATWQDKKIGSHGDIVAWSFYPGKNLGALGDGGAITTQSATLAQKVAELGNYGSKQKYYNDVKGVNSRLDELQAAVLSVKLKHLDKWNIRRQEIAEQYNDAFESLPFLKAKVPQEAKAVWHLYVIAHESRDMLQKHLSESGIQTIIHYPVAPHEQNAYAGNQFDESQVSQAQRYAKEVLSLPIGPHLSDVHVKQVINSVKQYFR